MTDQALATPLTTHSTEQRQILLEIADQAIEQGLDQKRWRPDPNHYDPALSKPGACFVTLWLNGDLRGCMGSLVATQALVLDVAENAWSAAFRDPRFAPLSRAEWPTVTVHLSIIGDSEPLACQSQVELLATLRPGIDGLILDDGIHRATFLPSVWEQLPVAEDFVQQLKRKAGIPIQAWPSNLRCHRYQVESFARDNPSQ